MTDWLGMAAQPRPPRPELRARVLARATTRRRPRVALAAAAVLLLALGGGGWWAWRTVRALAAERVARADLEQRLAALTDTLSLLRSPGTRVYQVPVSTNGRVGAITMFHDSVTSRWLVSCSGLAVNAPDEAYQIWFVTADGAHSAALMPMDRDESMVLALTAPKEGGQVTGVRMSIEPRAGSVTPQGPMVFQLAL
jgi:anti-sigma-K factor RskA